MTTYDLRTKSDNLEEIIDKIAEEPDAKIIMSGKVYYNLLRKIRNLSDTVSQKEDDYREMVNIVAAVTGAAQTPRQVKAAKAKEKKVGFDTSRVKTN